MDIVHATPLKRKVANMARNVASCGRDLSDTMCDFMEDRREVSKETHVKGGKKGLHSIKIDLLAKINIAKVG